MNFVVVSGSTQADSQSRKVGDYLSGKLERLGESSSVIDMHDLNLPMFGTDGDDGWKDRLGPAKDLLEAADGLVFVVPEWNGAAAPALLNLQLYIGHAIAHKPVMLVGVSAGRGGQYPLRDLRGSGYKNSKYVVIPESVVITDVNNMLNDDGDSPEAPDHYVKQRLLYALKVLVSYAEAMRGIRQSGVIDHDSYPFGM